MKTTPLPGDHAPHSDSARRGFFWLVLSYGCGTVFYISSKYLLNHLSVRHFLLIWYGAGMVPHILYGLHTGSFRFGDLTAVQRRILWAYAANEVVGTVCIFAGMSLMDPSIVAFFLQSQIIFTLILGYLVLGELLKGPELVASLVIIAGVATMSYRSVEVPPAGAALLLAGAFSLAVSFIIIRRYGESLGSITFARVRNVALFAVALTVDLALDGRVIMPPGRIVLIALAGALFGPFLNSISVFRTLDHIPAGKVTLLRSVQPLFVVIAGAVFLEMYPGVREMSGGLVIMAGSAALAWFHARDAAGMPRLRRFPRSWPR